MQNGWRVIFQDAVGQSKFVLRRKQREEKEEPTKPPPEASEETVAL